MMKTHAIHEKGHIPGGVVRRIESYNRLCEFKNAWTLLAHLHDATKEIGGILVCIAPQSVIGVVQFITS